jgi:hypothetical protein
VPAQEKFPRIGSLAKTLDLMQEKDADLWEDVFWCIEHDHWKQTLNEVTDLMDAVSTKYLQMDALTPARIDHNFFYETILGGNSDSGSDKVAYRKKLYFGLHEKTTPDRIDRAQARFDRIFFKMERIAFITIWEVNQLQYLRLITSILRSGRRPAPLIARIEHHVLRNMAMDYKLDTIIDIAHTFLRLSSGSPRFYREILRTIETGHRFEAHTPATLNYFPLGNNYVLKTLNILEYSKNAFSNTNEALTLTGDFQAKLLGVIKGKKYDFSLKELMLISEKVRDLNLLQYEDEEDMRVIEEGMNRKFVERVRKECFGYSEMVQYVDWGRGGLGLGEFVGLLGMVFWLKVF